MLEFFELCVYNAGADDYVIAQTFRDPREAILCLKGLAELNIDACIRYFCSVEE